MGGKKKSRKSHKLRASNQSATITEESREPSEMEFIVAEESKASDPNETEKKGFDVSY